MSLTMLEKELIAVAVSVAAGCRPCTTYHVGAARKAGADDAAIQAAVAGAVCVRSDATEGMRRHALGKDPAPAACGCAPTTELAELMALGAALAVNCTANIARHLEAARGLGATQERLDAVHALVAMIRSHALKHAAAAFGSPAPEAAVACCG
ncbi:carboxymuconolactone decarboxylase family protein [Novispirillum sp. DQ9]|uniref:carboxymuconolactone decarboxylase family protein n=1 Tax=Novispirillum sp. DQ9 TaxID=3398612 RepID=UPI003C7DF553